VFYHFLGKLVNFTDLGEWFNWLFPCFVLVPVCAAIFNLYGKVANCTGFGGVIEDDEDENESGYGTGSWREGRDLIERELQGYSSLGSLGHTATNRRTQVPNNPHNRAAPTLSVPPAERARSPAQASTTRSRTNPPPQIPNEPENENFFEAFSHRVRNTLDTMQTPQWFQNAGEGVKRPKWMGGGENANTESSGSGNGFMKWFGGSRDGRVRL